MTEWVDKSYHWEVCMRGDRTAYLCQSHSSIALLSWCIARQMHSSICARYGGGSEMHVDASSFCGRDIAAERIRSAFSHEIEPNRS